jgi:hypothetical protein
MCVKHKKVWGYAGLPLESPRLSSHIGATARKHGFWVAAAAFPPFEPLGDRLFRAFAVRDENGSDGRVRICAPHVVLRFEGLKNRFRTKEFLKPGFSPLK